MEVLALIVLALYGAGIAKTIQSSTPSSSRSNLSPDLVDPGGKVIVSSAEMNALFSAADREETDE